MPTHADRIRILQVAPQLSTGGLEKLLVEFARHIDRERFDLRFLALGARGLPADEIEESGWPVDAYGKPDGLSGKVIVRLVGDLRRWRPRVVHTHNNSALVYSAAALTCAGSPAELIHTRHGQNYLSSPRETLLTRTAALRARMFVCVSHDSERITHGERVARGKLTTLWNGIDTRLFDFTGPSEGGPVVCVARLSGEKNIGLLLESAHRLRQVEPGIRFEIAGTGPDHTELARRCVEMGLDSHVSFLGEVKDVPALLGRASLFVLPSITEGISLTLLEAMARGLPVVATRVGGNAEVIVEGQTGLLTPSGDAGALADAIALIHRDSETARRMGLAGRERVVREFDSRNMVRRYEALYEQLRGEPSRPK